MQMKDITIRTLNKMGACGESLLAYKERGKGLTDPAAVLRRLMHPAQPAMQPAQPAISIGQRCCVVYSGMVLN